MAKDHVAHASIVLNAPIARVWKALIDPRAIKEYMFDTNVESEWKKGSRITWKGEWQGKAYEDKGVILELQPDKRLKYSHFSPLSGQADSPENYHTVTIDLAVLPDGVSVALTQDNNATAEARDHSAKNWEMMLAALKQFVEL